MHEFRKGFVQGVSIALGYLSVSFSFGILAVQSGLTVWQAVLISVTNLTSAGQVAGVGLIAEHAAFAELFLAELVINIRYALMTLALSQKTDRSFRLPQRLLTSYGVTDEIFAVASLQPEPLKPKYMYGLILISFLGWTCGTWLGAAAGTLLPVKLTNALGIALYGMFLAIILPPARKSRGILAVILIAAAISVFLKFAVTSLSGGFAMIIASVIAAVIGAAFFPADDAESKEADA
ncbi:MAG: AzlC family ABC transporter permease [Oscillospiraceae bacterium]|nr:AzlC family ABC transporter permease [Oscillospiraceae bacterium]